MKLSYMGGILSMAVMLCISAVPIMAQDTADTFVHGTMEVDSSSSHGEIGLTPDDSMSKGSITIYLEDTDKKSIKENVKLEVVKVADVVDGSFVLKEKFETIDIDLNDIQNANELELAAKKLLQKVEFPDVCALTNKEGIGGVSDLSVGVYLIYAKDIAEYENITPVLVSIPTFDELDDAMVFDVEVYPKHTPIDENERPDIPQTGIENHAKEYAALSIILFVGSVVCILFYANKKWYGNRV